MIRITGLAVVAAFIGDMRILNRLRQRDLAVASGHSQGQVSAWELGNVIPSVQALIDVAAALGYDLIDEPAVIHATLAELHTELFWSLHIDPVARAHGMEQPTELDNRDPGRHLLKHPDGRLLLIVITDRRNA